MDAVDALERLEAPFDIADALERDYFIELPIDVAHAVAAGELPGKPFEILRGLDPPSIAATPSSGSRTRTADACDDLVGS